MEKPTYEQLLIEVKRYRAMLSLVPVTKTILYMDNRTHILDVNLQQITNPIMVFPHRDALYPDVHLVGVQLEFPPTNRNLLSDTAISEAIVPYMPNFQMFRATASFSLPLVNGVQEKAQLSLNGPIYYRSGRVILTISSPDGKINLDTTKVGVQFGGHLNSFKLFSKTGTMASASEEEDDVLW